MVHVSTAEKAVAGAHSLPRMRGVSCKTEARGSSLNRFGILPLAIFGKRISDHSQVSSYTGFFPLHSFNLIEKLKKVS